MRKIAASLLFLLSLSCGNHHLLKEVKKLEHYPSASGIEFFNHQLYVMGDDASQLLVLDTNLQVTDSFSLYGYKEKRIPKSIKPDLEAMTVVRTGGRSRLLLIGSGSVAPYRNIAVWIDPVTRQVDSTRMDTLYQRFLSNGIQEINIEGGCMIAGSLVLCNRGNKAYPVNKLIFLDPRCWSNQALTAINSVRLGGNKDSAYFNGVSGMAYSYRSDRLIMTVSTEDTRNALDDGAIGKSYLWIVKNISAKKRWKAINPDQQIDLEALDPRFKGQKIESVCITAETRDFLHLVLAADNDDGSSTLFKMIVEKK